MKKLAVLIVLITALNISAQTYAKPRMFINIVDFFNIENYLQYQKNYPKASASIPVQSTKKVTTPPTQSTKRDPFKKSTTTKTTTKTTQTTSKSR